MPPRRRLPAIALALLVALASVFGLLAQTPAPGAQSPAAAASNAPTAQITPALAPDPAREARLAWFRDAKYGLFIHWGLYAIPAGEWEGRTYPGIGEWIMYRARIPVRQYEKLAQQFNPTKFDADAIVRLAKDAGMKYIVITSKHHDGFALFDSKVSTYDAVDATPAKRDLIGELADACRKHGMRLGFYYSQAQDWHEPNGAGNTWDFAPDDKKDFDQYLRDKAEPQVRELLTRYGPVALIWFDTPRLMTPARAKRFTDIVRELQPNTLIDGRLGAEGDYISTGDNVIPNEIGQEAWETPATINHTWGYRKDDHDWKSAGDVVFKLADIVSKGGNYLLNIGPMADGTVPQPSQDVLRTVGAWLKKNGEAIYGAQATPFGEELGEHSGRGTKTLGGRPMYFVRREYRITTKPGKLYFIFFEDPRSQFELPAMKNTVTRAYRLTDGLPVEVKTENGKTRLGLERPASGGWCTAEPGGGPACPRFIDPMGTVFVVEFEGNRVLRE
jgi:alpha-L-fucosidase